MLPTAFVASVWILKEVLVFFEVKGKLIQECYPIWFTTQELFGEYGMKIMESHKNYNDLKSMF